VMEGGANSECADALRTPFTDAIARLAGLAV
jgi:hypothetical protein